MPEQPYLIRSAPAGAAQCAFLFYRNDSLHNHAFSGYYVGAAVRDERGQLMFKHSQPFREFTVDAAGAVHFFQEPKNGDDPRVLLAYAVPLMHFINGERDTEAMQMLLRGVSMYGGSMKFEQVDFAKHLPPQTFGERATVHVWPDLNPCHSQSQRAEL